MRGAGGAGSGTEGASGRISGAFTPLSRRRRSSARPSGRVSQRPLAPAFSRLADGPPLAARRPAAKMRIVLGGSGPRAKARVEDRFAAKGRERPWQRIAGKIAASQGCDPHRRPTVAGDEPAFQDYDLPNCFAALRQRTAAFQGHSCPFPAAGGLRPALQGGSVNARSLFYLHFRGWRREMDRIMMGTSQGAPRLDDGVAVATRSLPPACFSGSQSRRVILGCRWFLGNYLTVQPFREAAENFASTSGARNFRSGWIAAN